VAAPAEPEKKEEKVEVPEPQAEAPIETPSLAPEQLTEIIGKPAMSQAELKKLAELKRLKREGKMKKEKKVDEGDALPKLPPVSLPPVGGRRGAFEIIPDFLKQKELARDLTNIGEKDMMAEALKKQEEKMKDQFEGMSMAEIAAAKR
jgi:hypothetical protein